MLLAFVATVGVYTAPELYNEEIFDKNVDAFSFAVILYEVLRIWLSMHQLIFYLTIKLSLTYFLS